jgi:hypothetical protein
LFSSEIAEKPYAKHVKDMAVIQVNDRMMVRACKELANVLISCDGTWQRWVSSLYDGFPHFTGQYLSSL